MMSLREIEAGSRRAARESAARHIEPMVIWPGDADAAGRGRSSFNTIPFIGDRCPRGWKRVKLTEDFDAKRRGIFMGDNRGYGAYMVDASGVGSTSEPALSYTEMVERLKVNYGYAIVEAGPFQVKIGVYERMGDRLLNAASQRVVRSAMVD